MNNYLNPKRICLISAFALHLALDSINVMRSQFGIVRSNVTWSRITKLVFEFHVKRSLFNWQIPVWTKFVGFPIIDRSIRMRWWRWRLRGLCGWWKQHENHWTHISPVLAISLAFIHFELTLITQITNSKNLKKKKRKKYLIELVMVWMII